MRLRLLSFFCIGLLAAAASGASQPAELADAILRQNAANEAIKSLAADGQIALRKWYESALEAVKKEAVRKGDLDGVVAADAERERVDRDLTAEEKARLPELLRTVRTQYDQARAQRAGQLKAGLLAAGRAYLATLETLEKNLTRQGDIDGALAARQERSTVAGQLGALQGGAAPAPAAAATVPPAAPEPKPAPSASPVAEAPVIQLAARMEARKEPISAAVEAIRFGSPYGPERSRGGGGLLLKNDPNTGRRGTTWSCTMTFSMPAHGVMFIHPHGGGQTILHLRPTGIYYLPCSEVTKTPWTGGDPKRVKLTSAAAGLFPLQPKQHYTVASQLNGAGKYTLVIDGKIVGTATFDAGPSLTLDARWAGPKIEKDFPLKWGPGFAGIGVGPAEGGSNLCEDVTFQASAP